MRDPKLVCNYISMQFTQQVALVDAKHVLTDQLFKENSMPFILAWTIDLKNAGSQELHFSVSMHTSVYHRACVCGWVGGGLCINF